MAGMAAAAAAVALFTAAEVQEALGAKAMLVVPLGVPKRLLIHLEVAVEREQLVEPLQVLPFLAAEEMALAIPLREARSPMLVVVAVQLGGGDQPQDQEVQVVAVQARQAAAQELLAQPILAVAAVVAITQERAEPAALVSSS